MLSESQTQKMHTVCLTDRAQPQEENPQTERRPEAGYQGKGEDSERQLNGHWAFWGVMKKF